MDLKKLKDRDSRFLEKLYDEYRKGFILFASRYPLDRDEIIDIYQDTFVALIENAGKGYLDHLRSDLKTYLFSIGKYMIYARLKEKKLPLPLSDEVPEHFEWFETDAVTDETDILETALKQLGGTCYKILKLFYYEEKKHDEIMKIMDYDSKDVLKSQKARCLKRLKDLMQKK